MQTGPEPKPRLKGDSRTFRVFLDPNQYQQDMTNTIQSGREDVYETFNIIMRRKPKENNFKVSHSAIFCLKRNVESSVFLVGHISIKKCVVLVLLPLFSCLS